VTPICGAAAPIAGFLQVRFDQKANEQHCTLDQGNIWGARRGVIGSPAISEATVAGKFPGRRHVEEAINTGRATIYRCPAAGGWIVRSRANDLGPGKVVAIDDDVAAVEYFYTPGRQETIRVPSGSVSRVSLEPQTRCYLYSEEAERWVMGRIKARYDADFQVDLPDGRSVFVTEAQIYVRCSKPGDPMDSLLARGHETAFFHAPRTRFVRSVLRQRAGYRGLTALASAPIELYPHQVEVIRRVVEDPVQRYLLADEVGLGKTIEAGVIIRQHLLDDPLSEVLVVVPPSLVEQWRRELSSRVGLPVGDLVHVCTEGEVHGGADVPAGMLVIDEAHHLAGCAFSTLRTDRERFARIAHLAHRAERLLLLSATPASSNERQFLAMLHLLDPLTYRLDDLAGFRQRIAKRQDIGRLLLTLRDDADPFTLGIALRKLGAIFPNDGPLGALAAELQSSLATDSPPETLEAQIRRLRTHISETYRIHRRMLRNRRAEWDGTLLARRATEDGTFAPLVIEDEDARVGEAHDLIDDWRAYAFDALSMSALPEDESLRQENATACLLQLLLQCASTSLSQLKALVRARLDNSSGYPELGASTEVQAALALSAPRFAEEAQILQRLLLVMGRPAEQPTRADRLASFLRELRDRAGVRPPPKCVVFCPNDGVSAEVAQSLSSRLGKRAVALVTNASMTVPETLRNFQSNRDCFVLVADSVAEEGLNLQFAEYLVLLDLPWSPNHLEQRIGRLDRIGRTRPVRTIVFVAAPGLGSMYEAWLEVLRDAIGIFKESAASLQFFIENKLPVLHHSMLAEGANGLRGEIPMLRDAITAEQARLREQAALDEIDANGEHTSRFFSTFDDLDADADQLQEAFEGWACSVLKLERTKSQSRPHVVEYAATKHSLIPASVLKAGIASQLEEKCTFRRSVAAAGSGISLARIGHGLVDNLWKYVQWDDRGRAYAIWRHEPTFDASEGAEWLGFKLHYIVEADTELIRRAVASSPLPAHAWRPIHRRADALLQPFMDVLYFDLQGREVTDPDLLSRLRRPCHRVQDGGSDTNLHKNRVSILDSMVAAGHWEWACQVVRSASEEALRARETFRDSIGTAYRDATRQVEAEAALLASRASADHDLVIDMLGIVRDREVQSALGRGLLDAIANPAVRLDSVGFIVLSGRPAPTHT
jgi:ATP-dependent helicase HepA